MSAVAQPEVYAVKFAQHHRARRADFFHGAGAEPGDGPASIDYFVWLIRTAYGDIVLDAGFTPEVAKRRNRPDYYRSPHEALELVGVDCERVPYVVLSHLHYDHAGDLAHFPGATVVLQDRELSFWTGRYAHRREFVRHIETEDIGTVVQLSLQGRVEFVSGDQELVPGVSVHLVGGHTAGMQVVRILSEDGPLVLASDAAHLADNIGLDAPTAVFGDLAGMYGAFDRMLELAEGRLDHVVPGHDPALLGRLPAVPGLEGIAGRLL